MLLNFIKFYLIGHTTKVYYNFNIKYCQNFKSKIYQSTQIEFFLSSFLLDTFNNKYSKIILMPITSFIINLNRY